MMNIKFRYECLENCSTMVTQPFFSKRHISQSSRFISFSHSWRSVYMELKIIYIHAYTGERSIAALGDNSLSFLPDKGSAALVLFMSFLQFLKVKDLYAWLLCR